MLEKGNQEVDSLRNREQLSQESSKRIQRQLRDAREEIINWEQRDADTSQQVCPRWIETSLMQCFNVIILQVREQLQRIELMESENATLVKDLSLALRRIEDLQVAMQGDMDSSDSDRENRSDERYCPFIFY